MKSRLASLFQPYAQTLIVFCVLVLLYGIGLLGIIGQAGCPNGCENSFATIGKILFFVPIVLTGGMSELLNLDSLFFIVALFLLLTLLTLTTLSILVSKSIWLLNRLLRAKRA